MRDHFHPNWQRSDKNTESNIPSDQTRRRRGFTPVTTSSTSSGEGLHLPLKRSDSASDLWSTDIPSDAWRTFRRYSLGNNRVTESFTSDTLAHPINSSSASFLSGGPKTTENIDNHVEPQEHETEIYTNNTISAKHPYEITTHDRSLHGSNHTSIYGNSGTIHNEVDETTEEQEDNTNKKSPPDQKKAIVKEFIKEIMRERLKDSYVYTDKKGTTHVGPLATAAKGFDQKNARKVNDKEKADPLREKWIEDAINNDEIRIYQPFFDDDHICVARNQEEAQKILNVKGKLDDQSWHDESMLDHFYREEQAFNKLQTLIKKDRNLQNKPENILPYEYRPKKNGEQYIIMDIDIDKQKEKNKSSLGDKQLSVKKRNPITYEYALEEYLFRKAYGKDSYGCKITINDGQKKTFQFQTAESEQEMKSLFEKNGDDISEDELKQADSINNNNTINDKQNAIKTLERKKRIPELKKIVEQTTENIHELHKTIYGKPAADSGNIGFMVKIDDKKLQKYFGMKSNEQFFTADQFKAMAKHYSFLQEYDQAVAKMEAGDQYALKRFGGEQVKITCPGLIQIEQKLEEIQKNMTESLKKDMIKNDTSEEDTNEEDTNKKSNTILHAFQIVKVHSQGNDKLRKRKPGAIDVIEDLDDIQKKYGVTADGDLHLGDIKLDQTITFKDEDDDYVQYKRIALNDAKIKIEGQKTYSLTKELLLKYDGLVDSNYSNPLKKQEADQRKKDMQIHVGSDSAEAWLKDSKTAYAALVNGKLRIAKNEKAMREAFPGKLIEPLTPREAEKYMKGRVQDEQAPENIRNIRNDIVGYSVMKAYAGDSPDKTKRERELEWEQMKKAGRIEFRLQQDQEENKYKYVFELEYSNKEGKLDKIYYIGNSLHEAADQLKISYETVKKVNKGYEHNILKKRSINDRHIERIIKQAKEKNKLQLVNDPGHNWFVFESKTFDVDGKVNKRWYVTDNSEFNKTDEGEGTKMIKGYIRLGEFPKGVSAAPDLDKRTLWEKMKGVRAPGILLNGEDVSKDKSLLNTDLGDENKSLLNTDPRDEEDDSDPFSDQNKNTVGSDPSQTIPYSISNSSESSIPINTFTPLPSEIRTF